MKTYAMYTLLGLGLSFFGLGQIETLKDVSPISLVIISLGGLLTVFAMYKQNQLYIQQAKDNQAAMIQQSEYSQKLLADSLQAQQSSLIAYKLESDKGHAETYLKAFDTLSKGARGNNGKESHDSR